MRSEDLRIRFRRRLLFWLLIRRLLAAPKDTKYLAEEAFFLFAVLLIARFFAFLARGFAGGAIRAILWIRYGAAWGRGFRISALAE